MKPAPTVRGHGDFVIVVMVGFCHRGIGGYFVIVVFCRGGFQTRPHGTVTRGFCHRRIGGYFGIVVFCRGGFQTRPHGGFFAGCLATKGVAQ